jgi:hypothetical protein
MIYELEEQAVKEPIEAKDERDVSQKKKSSVIVEIISLTRRRTKKQGNALKLRLFQDFLQG